MLLTIYTYDFGHYRAIALAFDALLKQEIAIASHQ
jgi:hypothetical protein